MPQSRFPLGIATGAAFCNRREERRELAEHLLAGRHTLLVAPRRYGKTSLAYRTIADLEARREPRVVAAGCDFLVAHDEHSVRDILLDAVGRLSARCVPRGRRALDTLARFFKGLKPELTISTEGARLGFTPVKGPAESITEALTGLDRLAASRKVRAVLLMDEFQSLASLRAGTSVEAAIRHAAERTGGTTFVFSGSNRHLLLAMFDDAARPLYHLCERLHLRRIAAADYRPFIKRAARHRWKASIDDEAIERILEVTRRHPYYVNLVCSRLWRADAPPDAAAVEKVWRAYVTEEPNWLTREVASLSPNQRAVIAALAAEPTDKPQSKAFLERTRLAGASNAQAIQVLLERDLIYRDGEGVLRVLDPALESYLGRLVVGG